MDCRSQFRCLTRTLFVVELMIILVNSVSSNSLNSTSNTSLHGLEVIYSWRKLEFAWPENINKSSILPDGSTYNPESVILGGIQVWQDRIFVSIPRYRPGVPVTLATVSVNSSLHSPIVNSHGQSGVSKDSDQTKPNWNKLKGFHAPSPSLEAYPSWKMQEVGNCVAFQNVQNMEVDSSGRLWIVDNGRINTLTKNDSIARCPAKLVIFDLKMNKEIRQFDFPETVVNRCTSLLSDIMVDMSHGEDSPFAYITDAETGAIVVYDYKNNQAWKARHDTMKTNVEAPEINIAGNKHIFDVGGSSIALSPLVNGSANVYYSTLSSHNLFSVPTTVLRNETAATGNLSEFVTEFNQKKPIADGIVMDSDGNMYYGAISKSSIVRWNPSSEIADSSSQQELAQSDKLLNWVHSMTIDPDGYLWISANTFHEYMEKRMNFLVINFRILRLHVGKKPYWYKSNETHSEIDKPNRTYYKVEGMHLDKSELSTKVSEDEQTNTPIDTTYDKSTIKSSVLDQVIKSSTTSTVSVNESARTTNEIQTSGKSSTTSSTESVVISATSDNDNLISVGTSPTHSSFELQANMTQPRKDNSMKDVVFTTENASTQYPYLNPSMQDTVNDVQNMSRPLPELEFITSKAVSYSKGTEAQLNTNTSENPLVNEVSTTPEHNSTTSDSVKLQEPSSSENSTENEISTKEYSLQALENEMDRSSTFGPDPSNSTSHRSGSSRMLQDNSPPSNGSKVETVSNADEMNGTTIEPTSSVHDEFNVTKIESHSNSSGTNGSTLEPTISTETGGNATSYPTGSGSGTAASSTEPSHSRSTDSNNTLLLGGSVILQKSGSNDQSQQNSIHIVACEAIIILAATLRGL